MVAAVVVVWLLPGDLRKNCIFEKNHREQFSVASLVSEAMMGLHSEPRTMKVGGILELVPVL